MERMDSRGGRREGAGRKTVGKAPRVPLSARVEPATLERIAELAEAQGVSKGVMIDKIMEKYGK